MVERLEREITLINDILDRSNQIFPSFSPHVQVLTFAVVANWFDPVHH